jgi:hypothetical protein
MVCLPDLDRDMFHILYRHGACVTITCSHKDNNCNQIENLKSHITKSTIQHISKDGVGNAYLINSKCMVFRHSKEVLFFRREAESNNG